MSTFSNLRPSRIYPNWEIWFENKPSGNPGVVRFPGLGSHPSFAAPTVTPTLRPGLPDCIFSNKNPSLGEYLRILQWKMCVYFINIWPILRPIGIFYAHFVYFTVIWYICFHFGLLYQEKSGNPGSVDKTRFRRFKILFSSSFDFKYLPPFASMTHYNNAF
jgi:hypothetical protein